MIRLARLASSMPALIIVIRAAMSHEGTQTALSALRRSRRLSTKIEFLSHLMPKKPRAAKARH